MNTTATAADTTTPAAHGLAWSDRLRTGDGRMDDTHEEFVQMLNELLALPESEQLPLYLKFIDHTVEHFAQEERWMVAVGFAPDNCHASHQFKGHWDSCTACHTASVGMASSRRVSSSVLMLSG